MAAPPQSERPWVRRQINRADGDVWYTYDIVNLSETELLWIHDALVEKLILLREELNDRHNFQITEENTDAEDVMFLGESISKIARMVFLIKDLLSK